MTFHIFQIRLDKFIRFSVFDRGMTAAPHDLKSVSGCYAGKLKNTTKIGHFRINEQNYFSAHVISEIPTATHIFST